MEKYLSYRILDLEKKLEAYKRGVDTLSSDEEITEEEMMEAILAPILVWFIIGENPGSLTLVGGFIVLIVLSKVLIVLKAF